MTSFFSGSTTNATPYAFDKVIKVLLKHYPEAALVPQGKSGRLPLVMAIRAGQRSWDDGIQTLLTAYPPGIHSAKVRYIYPEVLALAGGGGRIIPSYQYPSSKSESLNGDNGGMRILQNLWLVAASQHRREHTGRRRRKYRSNSNMTKLPGTTSSHHTRGSAAVNSAAESTLDPRTLNTMFELLRARPDLVDKETYASEVTVAIENEQREQGQVVSHAFKGVKAIVAKFSRSK